MRKKGPMRWYLREGLWKVETGKSYRCWIEASSAEKAVIEAFKGSPPEAPGILTNARTKGASFYMDTINFLKRAGYEER